MRRVNHDPNYIRHGIDMDPHWEDVAIYVEDMLHLIGPQPFPGATIDRINNDRGYWPNNVQWATPKQQANNRGHEPPDACLLNADDSAQVYTCWPRAWERSCEACPWPTWE